MRAADWIKRMPAGTSERLAGHAVWRAACIDGTAWPDAASSAAAVKLAAEALPRDARELLTLILRKYGPRPFEDEQLAEFAESAGWTAAAVKRALFALCAAGIVFTLRKSWGDRFHCLPADGYVRWLHALLPASIAPLAAEEGRAVRPQQPYTEPLSLQLLQAAAALVKAGQALTARGALPKRAADVLSARLKLGTGALQALAIRTARGEGTVSASDLALDALVRLGLLAVSEGRIDWHEEQFAAWLAADAAVRERQLLDLMSDRFAAYDERYMHAAALLRGMRGGLWYLTAPVEDWLARHAPSAARQWRGWLDVLAGFGWLQTGRTADGGDAVRWTIDCDVPEDGSSAGDAAPDVRAAGLVRIVPPGEIIIPPDAAYGIRWELELLAEPLSPGPLAGYAFTAKSIGRYLELGRTEQDVLHVLETSAGELLPDGVRRMAADYAQQSGRAAFAEALLLRFADEASAARAAADPLVAPLLGERLGARCFVVERPAMPELRKRLARAGMPAKSGLEGSGDPPAKAPLGLASATGRPLPEEALDPQDGEAAAGFLDTPFPWQLYAVDSAAVEAGCGHPAAPAGRTAEGRERLPSAWLRSVREYHPSTRREMVKRAIELGAAVRLVRAGRTIEVLPSRIDEREGEWRLHGRLAEPENGESALVTLSPDMWSAMQLLLPDDSPLRK